MRGDLPRSRMIVGGTLLAKESVAAETHGQYKPQFLAGLPEILGEREPCSMELEPDLNIEVSSAL